jgi:hypothetical protein
MAISVLIIAVVLLRMGEWRVPICRDGVEET